MKNKNVKLCTILLCLGATVSAQQVTSSSGGDASGSGGSIAYSVGQVVYLYTNSTTGSVAEGVEQPYEISIVTSVNEYVKKDIGLTVYPNPTTNLIKLKVESSNIDNLSFQLYDLQGKLLETQKINSANTLINVENFPNATYFVKVLRNNKEVETFKIIKN